MRRRIASMSSNVSPTAPPSAPMISANAPRGVAITGVPLAIASTTFRPNGSSHCAGIQSQRAPAAGHHQAKLAELRRADGDAPAFGGVQSRDKEIEIGLLGAEFVLVELDAVEIGRA